MEDRTSKKPFDPSRKINSRLKKAALDAGLVCYPMGGTLDGVQGDHVLFAPPFIVEEAHLDELVSKFSRALTATLGVPAALAA